MKAVTERVKEELLSEVHINRCLIEVECSSEGDVILRGQVSSFYQKQMAQETVKRVIKANGFSNLPQQMILNVRNEIQVNWF